MTAALKDLADAFAVAGDVTDGAVVAILRLPHRGAITVGEDVLALEYGAAPLGKLVDPVKLHCLTPARGEHDASGAG